MIVQKGKKTSAELITQEQARRQDSRLPTRARGFSEPEARKEATRSSQVLVPSPDPKTRRTGWGTVLGVWHSAAPVEGPASTSSSVSPALDPRLLPQRLLCSCVYIPPKAFRRVCPSAPPAFTGASLRRPSLIHTPRWSRSLVQSLQLLVCSTLSSSLFF